MAIFSLKSLYDFFTSFKLRPKLVLECVGGFVVVSCIAYFG